MSQWVPWTDAKLHRAGVQAPVDEVPDIVGTVRGYRSFKYRDGWLWSINWDYQWQAGLNVAVCKRFKHFRRVPVMECGCGLYSCTSPDSSQITRTHKTSVGTWVDPLFGVTENSGLIWQHENNTVQRAEYSRLVAVATGGILFPWQKRRLVKNYPGVKFYRTRGALLRDYPPGQPLEGTGT